jgi:hypothetical protein
MLMMIVTALIATGMVCLSLEALGVASALFGLAMLALRFAT